MVCEGVRADELPATKSPSAQRLELPQGFRPSNETDYALTLVGFAGTAMLTLALKPDPDAGWYRPLLFDEPVRDALVASSEEGRHSYDVASNLTFASGLALVAFDALAIAWAADRNPRVARELLWMDAEAYALTLLVTNATKLLVLRRRPYTVPCSSNSGHVSDCNSGQDSISFWSGHSANAATSAGLVCVQHQHLRLYGGAGDALACAGAVGAMMATGLFRIASDNHWATDVAVGYLVGFASGYGLPLLLHFRGGKAESTRRSGLNLRVLPLSDGSNLSVYAVGLF